VCLFLFPVPVFFFFFFGTVTGNYNVASHKQQRTFCCTVYDAILGFGWLLSLPFHQCCILIIHLSLMDTTENDVAVKQHTNRQTYAHCIHKASFWQIGRCNTDTVTILQYCQLLILCNYGKTPCWKQTQHISVCVCVWGRVWGGGWGGCVYTGGPPYPRFTAARKKLEINGS